MVGPGGGGGARSELAIARPPIDIAAERAQFSNVPPPSRDPLYHLSTLHLDNHATHSTARAWFLDAVRNTARTAWPRRKKKINK